MPSILNLKFKGNKSFVAFSNLNDSESLTKTWKICTKVASYLEQGQRLENLSWRLWHLQSLMVDADNAKSKREFKRLSKFMGDKLDKEKGRSIEELEAPDYKHTHSTDMIRQRAAEKERDREASQNAQPGTIKRLQFTFSVEKPSPVDIAPVKKPDPKPSADISVKRSKFNAHIVAESYTNDMIGAGEHYHDNNDSSLTQHGRKPSALVNDTRAQSLRLPPVFSNDLNSTPTLTTCMNYGEEAGLNPLNDGFGIVRPTIELPLDELLITVDSADSPWSTSYGSNDQDTRLTDDPNSPNNFIPGTQDFFMSAPIIATFTNGHHESDEDESDEISEDSDVDLTTLGNLPPISQIVKEMLPKSISTSRNGPGSNVNTSTGRPALTVRTQATPITRSSGPGATATSVNPVVLKHTGNNNSAPGGVKAECSNCGATHTPLWRRGLNDELNCNACGLYCKLHKRPRPKSMRNTHGEGRTQAAPRQECVDVMAQCYNCHTTATPLWRKDDEGKTVCNACGLYYKLHGSPRPISMKSDVIRKRSRHDARRVGIGPPETPTASPGVSRRPSPTREVSPTLAPDSTTQMSYDFHEDSDYRSSQSELMGALGPETNQHLIYNSQGAYTTSPLSFPGPYHPDYLSQLYNIPPPDALPFASVDASDMETMGMTQRTNKRRRMSTNSDSEPPSSAASYSSYADSYSTTSSAASRSQRSSMEFPFSSYSHQYSMLRGSGNTFWHPPMRPQDSPQCIHPPMLPPADSPMDYLHPPMMPHDDDGLFSAYLHPPMLLPPDENTNAPMPSMQPHPPMFPNDTMYTNSSSSRSDHYDSNMHTY